MSLGFTGSTPDVSAVAVHDLRGDLGEQVALDEVRAGPEDPAGLLNVPQSDAAGTREGAARRDRLEDGRHVGGAQVLAREQRRPARDATSRAKISGSVTVPSRTSAPGRLPVLPSSPLQSRMSSNTWKARPMRRPYSESAVAGLLPGAREHGAEPAGGREQIGRLALAAPLVLRLRHRRAVSVVALQHFALGEAHGGGAEDVDRRRVAGSHQLLEGARQQEVARRDGDLARRRRGPPSAGRGAARRGRGRRRGPAWPCAAARPTWPPRSTGSPSSRVAARAEQREQRTHALAAGGERGAARLAERAGVGGRDRRESLLDQVHAARVAALLQRRAPGRGSGGRSPPRSAPPARQATSPTWTATAPRPKRR